MFIDLHQAYIVALMFFLVSGGLAVMALIPTLKGINTSTRFIGRLASILLVLFSFSYGLMTITEHERLRYVFWAVGYCAGLSFFPVWSMFLLHMTPVKHKVFRHLSKAMVVIVFCVAIISVSSNDVVITMTERGNHFSYYNSTIFTVAFIITFIQIFPLVIMQFNWWRKSEVLQYRRLAKMFIVISAIIAPVGFFTDFVAPLFTIYTITPLAPIALLLVSLTTYVLTYSEKNRSISVRNISGFTFSSIMIPILVLDRNNNIGLTNKAAEDFFAKDTVGENIASCVLHNDKPPEQSLFDEGFASEIVTVATPMGIRTCDMLVSLEKDKLGDTMFKVVILRDQTEIADMHQKLDATMIDELTGVRTRRYFTEMAQAELDECIENNTPFSLVLIDIDHFKKVNDKYGHPVGDEVLKTLTARISNTLMANTLFARYGGEEFFVSLPGVNHKNVVNTAERIRTCIERNAFAIGDIKIDITISLGVASRMADSESLQDIIANADKALYWAKQTGRNKVVSA